MRAVQCTLGCRCGGLRLRQSALRSLHVTVRDLHLRVKAVERLLRALQRRRGVVGRSRCRLQIALCERDRIARSRHLGRRIRLRVQGILRLGERRLRRVTRLIRTGPRGFQVRDLCRFRIACRHCGISTGAGGGQCIVGRVHFRRRIRNLCLRSGQGCASLADRTCGLQRDQLTGRSNHCLLGLRKCLVGRRFGRRARLHFGLGAC